MIYRIILFIYHAISGLGRTWISFIASVSWSSDLLMSRSLQQNAIDAAINKWTRWLIACIRADRQRCEHFIVSFLWDQKENHIQIV